MHDHACADVLHKLKSACADEALDADETAAGFTLAWRLIALARAKVDGQARDGDQCPQLKGHVQHSTPVVNLAV